MRLEKIKMTQEAMRGKKKTKNNGGEKAKRWVLGG